MTSIRDAIASGEINKLAVDLTGSAFGIEAGPRGDHLVVGRRLGRDGTCNKVFIGVSLELQSQLVFRRLMIASGATRHWETGPLVRWSVDYTVQEGQEAAVEAKIAKTAPRLEAAFAWAKAWDGSNHNPSLKRLVEPGTYGVFRVSIDPRDGRYLVTCPKGKQSPLKALAAEFDNGPMGWWIPDHQEEGLAAAMDRQIRARTRAAEADAKAPVVGFGTLRVKTTDQGYTVLLAKNHKLSDRLHAHVKGVKWLPDLGAFLISHRNRQALIDWIEIERKAHEAAEGRGRPRDQRHGSRP